MQFYHEMRFRMLSQDYRNLLRKEAKLYSIVQKSFKKQRKYLEENIQDLYENHIYIISIEYNILQNQHVNLYPDKKSRKDEVWWDNPMQWFRRAMWVNELIEDMKLPLEKAFEHWYKKQYRKFRQLLKDNEIEYYPYNASEYAIKRWELNISNYKWSISHTTKRDVINTLKEWIDNHESRTDIQKKINSIDDKLFWLPRARTIAVTETAKAYEFWNRQPIEALQNVWIQMEKKWLTVWDDRVRPEHMECEEEWWQPIDHIYDSVWVDMPPWWVNCRCTMQYQRVR